VRLHREQAASIHRAVHVGLYPADGPNLHQLVADVDNALFLHKYRRMNTMYYNNCYLPVPVINMDYAAEDTTILLTSKQTMMIAILLLGQGHTDCLFNLFFLYFFLFFHIV